MSTFLTRSTSLAFPSISTGVYRYPIDLAAYIAVTAILESLKVFAGFKEVIVCCYSARDHKIYEGVLKELAV